MTILYRVETVHGSEFTFPVSREVALEQIADRMKREPIGDPLKVTRIDYALNPEGPPTTFTGPLRRVWRATVLRFPEIGSLGVYVCKDGSQHRYGNAADWAAPPKMNDADLVEFLFGVFRWHRDQGMKFTRSKGTEGLPISEVITRDKIATRAQGWTIRPYTGVFHATHEHDSAYPLIPTSRPCG